MSIGNARMPVRIIFSKKMELDIVMIFSDMTLEKGHYLMGFKDLWENPGKYECEKHGYEEYLDIMKCCKLEDFAGMLPKGIITHLPPKGDVAE